ncbi:MAG TPA: hypothetical protein VJ302_13320 [Blastocatellia bacterium]|nr:hypothetical protein [Blastocatellia bacterium]
MDFVFKITSWWRKREVRAYFEEQDYLDATALFVRLKQFSVDHHGEFAIHVNDLELRFDLDPDLSTIFEELPDVLEKLTSETTTPVDLNFFEQGTDLTFWMERKADHINVRFECGPYADKSFSKLPDLTFPISARMFLEEWIHFAQLILKALEDSHPKLIHDDSYREYRDRLQVLRENL